MKNLPRLNFSQLLCHFMSSTRLTCHKTDIQECRTERKAWKIISAAQIESGGWVAGHKHCVHSGDGDKCILFPGCSSTSWGLSTHVLWTWTSSEVPQQACLFSALWRETHLWQMVLDSTQQTFKCFYSHNPSYTEDLNYQEQTCLFDSAWINRFFPQFKIYLGVLFVIFFCTVPVLQ